MGSRDSEWSVHRSGPRGNQGTWDGIRLTGNARLLRRIRNGEKEKAEEGVEEEEEEEEDFPDPSVTECKRKAAQHKA